MHVHVAIYIYNVHVHVCRPILTNYRYHFNCIFSLSLPPHHPLSFMQRYVPNFPTMFSSLRHYPRQGVILDTTDPVPAHIPRQWRGYTEQARETLIRYKKLVSLLKSNFLYTCTHT